MLSFIFHNRSIRLKLIFSFVMVAILAVLASSIAIAVAENKRQKQTAIEHLQALSVVVSWNSVAAVLFNDSAAANEVLRSAGVQPNIVSACLYDNEGKLFANYSEGCSKSHQLANATLAGEEKNYELITSGVSEQIVMHTPVVHEDHALGEVLIVSDLVWLQKAFRQRIYLFAIIALFAVIFVTILSFLIERGFSRPINALVSLMSGVSNDKDYTIRGDVGSSSTEFIELYQGFNAMLQEIQVRDIALAKHREELEEQVTQRTQELVKTNRDLEQVVKELEIEAERSKIANKAKGEFLATISHEIRTPLHGILGVAQVMYATKLDGKQKEYLEKIATSGTVLLELINNVLDFAKIDSGNMELEEIPFDLEEFLDRTYLLFTDLAEKKGLKFELVRNNTEDLVLLGDPVRIRQIVHNIVSNAVKFTENGGVTIDAGVETIVESAHALLEVRVIDSGIGIPAEKVFDIFESFQQAEGDITRKYGGTGLGLSISKQLAMQMGGDIIVQSNVGAGSTFAFKVELPIDQAGRKKHKQPIHSQFLSESSPDDEQLTGEILVAEDNILNREVLGAMLKNLGCSIYNVGNGQEAVEAFVEKRFDLVLMDCHMPVMDGFSASRNIRDSGVEWSEEIPIIAITADVAQGVLQRCDEAGMTSYLSKPFSERDIRSLLKEYLS